MLEATHGGYYVSVFTPPNNLLKAFSTLDEASVIRRFSQFCKRYVIDFFTLKVSRYD